MGLNKNNTRVKTALDELVDCGFITTIIRYGNAVRDSKYIVSDPFCLFYSKWLCLHLMELKKTHTIAI